ncbi:hypothetical protein [Caloramator sp. Dgby_cultured_2]|uniref:hypothetical protein n=1 Tax=Caloramator sp. Dgby_cultured_2 TaxID=3029174 RepID=UPI00237DFC78|nr:hypothetical protein [Caloramator sp. Dgby_cultured_2]WDU82260.1 hypothetical protein PWK10_11175 [Caloramator sp. Dgby_cultured_2]
MNFPSIQDHGGIFGGGLNIKGIEKTYTVASGETIQAGDFIDFVNTKLTTIKKQKKRLIYLLKKKLLIF